MYRFVQDSLFKNAERRSPASTSGDKSHLHPDLQSCRLPPAILCHRVATTWMSVSTALPTSLLRSVTITPPLSKLDVLAPHSSAVS